MITISLDLQKSVDEITQMVLREFRIALNKAINSSLPNIKQRAGILVKNSVSLTPEFESLRNGKLRDSFGLKDPDYALIQILNKIEENVTVYFNSVMISGDELVGQLEVGLVKESYASLLGLPEASYQSGPYKVSWLEWLLLKGDSFIIAKYDVRHFNQPIDKSRTGNTLMVKTNKVYKVPPEYSGIQDDNFITRALTQQPEFEKMIGEIVEEEITRSLI